MRFILLLGILFPFFAFSQDAKDSAVLVTTEVKVNPPEIILNWPMETTTNYLVYRKLKSLVNYTTSFALLPSTATYGYINSGIETSADINKIVIIGKLILLVDSIQTLPEVSEINHLTEDLEVEDWTKSLLI